MATWFERFLRVTDEDHPVDILSDTVKSMVKNNVRHVKGDFRLGQVDLPFITNHLLQESVELQEAVFLPRHLSTHERTAQRKDRITSEAADLLGTYLHILAREGISIEDVCDRCHKNFAERFTEKEE